MGAPHDTRLPPPIPPRSPLRDAVYMDRAISLMAPLSPQNTSDSCAITFSSSTDDCSHAESLRSRPFTDLWSGHYDSCNQSVRSRMSASPELSFATSDISSDKHDDQLSQYHDIVESMRNAYRISRPSTPATPTTPSGTSGASTPISPASSFTSASEPDWLSPRLTEKPKSLRPVNIELLTNSISTNTIFDMIDQLPQTPSDKANDFSWFDVYVAPESPCRASIGRPYLTATAQSPAVSRLSLSDVPGRTSSLLRSRRRRRV